MPYVIRKKGPKKYVLVNTDTGKVRGTHVTRAGAQRQKNLLQGIEHGWKPIGKPARKPRRRTK